ncbi:hypothetical protein niasHT_005735 [Heterodera trifolii]|uniref:F-box domain-containing protein n=1 Tax=Heterodera trifolii TaxID=157864 RepID=A0ABD2M1P8_9BILA
MSDSPKEAEEKMKKAIFISADCWLCVFDLLSPRQFGLGIALISRRFDYYVDEHFKTRKWALKFIRIRGKIGESGTKKMKIVNSRWKPMPIPKIQFPRKVIGFKCIEIKYIDRNTIAFLHRFRQLFAKCSINLFIWAKNDRILEFILRNIWPMFGKSIHGMALSVTVFHRLRKFAPSFLNECPLLRIVKFDATADLFTEFPADDSAAASDGQALAKWLFTPLQSNVPKVLKCWLDMDDVNLASKLETFKSAFASASSPVNFIVVISFRSSSFAASVMSFDQTNELTREQLALKRINNSCHFLLIRCPIVRDENKWTKWEEEAIGWQFNGQWNKIEIQIKNKLAIGDGLLNATPGQSDRQK